MAERSTWQSAAQQKGLCRCAVTLEHVHLRVPKVTEFYARKFRASCHVMHR